MRRLLPLPFVLLFLLPSAASAAVQQGCTLDRQEGTVQKYTCIKGPITVAGYEVKQSVDLKELLGAPTPGVDGAITAMDVDVVDANSKPVGIDRLMLHHIVFVNLGQTLGERHDQTCGEFTLLDNRSKIPAWGERFYGAGEERAVMALPPGYGYPVKAKDGWGITWMLMNHRKNSDSAYIQYHVTIETAPVTPVAPYWLDVRDCVADPVYDVPGGGRKDAIHTETWDFTMPQAGRIIAGGGHVHGGGRELRVSSADCADRTLLRSRPAWGTAGHPFYKVKPVLHEPGPINMSGTLTAQGIPVGAGEKLRLSSHYDGELPHTRVMGIVMVYVAPDPAVTEKCLPLPNDIAEFSTNLAHRDQAPRFTVPLTGLKNGRAVKIARPPGATIAMPRGGRIDVGDVFYSKRNIAVRPGATLTWKFGGQLLHDVTLASGPRGFSSPHLDRGRTFKQKLSVAGTYRIFCSLHPVAMTQTVKVSR